MVILFRKRKISAKYTFKKYRTGKSLVSGANMSYDFIQIRLFMVIILHKEIKHSI